MTRLRRARKAAKVLLIARRRRWQRITPRLAYRIVASAERTGTLLHRLCALVEKESSGKPIFGCDDGSILCHERVTEARYRRLQRHVRRGGISNGVLYTQPTFGGFLLGSNYGIDGRDLWQPKPNLDFGAAHLDHLIDTEGKEAGYNAYNGDPTGAYGRDLRTRAAAWEVALR